MTKKVCSFLAVVSILVLVSMSLSAQDRDRDEKSADDSSAREVMNVEPPMHVHWARGQENEAHVNGQSRFNSANMTYHGGPIMQNVVVEPIFWGSGWSNSGDKISGMDLWYSGISGTEYARTTDEYTQSNNAHVTTSIAYTSGSYITDLSSAPNGAPATSTILNEVCSKIGKNAQTNGYYPVYIDKPRGSAGYCAWHSSGSCDGVPVQFAFFFNLDGDAGCDPNSSVSGQSEGLQALANVSGHELSEARTDPQLNAWFDRSGNENGDKCAWFFGGPFVTFSNNSQWKIQGNWSNYAYSNNKGYPNSKGQHGCIDGDNFSIPPSVAPF